MLMSGNGSITRAMFTLAAALGLTCSAALGGTSTHSTLASFRQNIVNDADFEPFDTLGFQLNWTVTGVGGYSYSIAGTSTAPLNIQAAGVCVISNDQGLVLTFTGRPVSAFAGTFRIASFYSDPATLGGTVNVQTNTGLSFPVTVPAGGGGAFFGFTSTEPFTSVTIADAAGFTFEFVDDVYVGTAITATDNCGDARTISPMAAASYPFATTGNTAQAISGVCDGAIDTGPDVWYRLVAPVTGSVNVGTCGCTFDSILRVFATCPSAAGEGQLACNDDACAGGGVGQNRGSQVSFRAVAGEDYLIRISGYSGGSGSGSLSYSVVPDCAGDFNHSGGTPSVQDIFDFLAAYFAGCP